MNEHEARARSIKAYKLARVWERMCDVSTALALGEPRAVPPHLRERIAKLAGVRAPSETTWELMCDMLDARARRVDA